MMDQPFHANRARQLVTTSLTIVEDIVYIGLGVVLAGAALWLLAITMRNFAAAVTSHALSAQIITLLDEILLILLVVELLYTVQVSFREHALVAEPFLVVALIATVRKILILTAQISQLSEATDPFFYHRLGELALLAAMVLVLVGSLILLHRNPRIAGVRSSDG